jgi:hypothetical protein
MKLNWHINQNKKKKKKYLCSYSVQFSGHIISCKDFLSSAWFANFIRNYLFLKKFKLKLNLNKKGLNEYFLKLISYVLFTGYTKNGNARDNIFYSKFTLNFQQHRLNDVSTCFILFFLRIHVEQKDQR